MTIDELRAKLLAARTGTPEQSLDTVVGIYKDCAAYIAALEEIQKQAKELISEIFVELATTEAQTSTGKIYVTRPSVTVSYDRKGLDALCASNPEVAAILAPYRTESQRAGTLTIR